MRVWSNLVAIARERSLARPLTAGITQRLADIESGKTRSVAKFIQEREFYPVKDR